MEYFFDHEWQHERERLRRLEEFFDPISHQNLECCDIRPGWRALEVGGGGGSIAEWLAWRVGPTGKVLVTDLETRFLDRLAGPTIDVQAHRFGVDPLPESSFDLIHARAVMEHQPDRMPALRQAYQTLRPGGWLALESADFTSLGGSQPHNCKFVDRMSDLLKRSLASRGFAWDCGRYLSTELQEAGFVNVTFKGDVFEWGGDDGALTAFYVQSFERLSQGITNFEGTGVTKAELDEFIELCKRRDFRGITHITCSVRGQKPR